eukprot:2378381-Prymnesium_polylepis.1
MGKSCIREAHRVSCRRLRWAQLPVPPGQEDGGCGHPEDDRWHPFRDADSVAHHELQVSSARATVACESDTNAQSIDHPARSHCVRDTRKFLNASPLLAP